MLTGTPLVPLALLLSLGKVLLAQVEKGDGRDIFKPHTDLLRAFQNAPAPSIPCHSLGNHSL